MNARTIFAISAALAIALMGCAADSTDADGSTEASEGADLSALPKVAGTFEIAGSETLGLAKSFTFDADGSYTTPSGRGTWTLAKAAKQLQITLDDSAAGKKTFFFSLAGNTMTFNVTLSGATAYFFDKSWHKKIPISGLCEDGHGHSLGECSDSGNFGCSEFDDVMTCNPLD